MLAETERIVVVLSDISRGDSGARKVPKILFASSVIAVRVGKFSR